MTTREQQLEQALRRARAELSAACDSIGIHCIDAFNVIDAALAAPQSAEAVAQPVYQVRYVGNGYTSDWMDYSREDFDKLGALGFTKTERRILYTAPPTDTLRAECLALVKKWR